MRHLHLVRHAKSAWEDGVADHERPLAPRGVRDTATLADHLRGAGVTPELALCSSARRTVETLDGLRAGLPDGLRVAIEDDLYAAGYPTLLARLQRVPHEITSVLVVGHNPGIATLARELAGDGDPDTLARLAGSYPTATLTSLRFEAAWAELEIGAAAVTAFVAPRDLRGP